MRVKSKDFLLVGTQFILILVYSLNINWYLGLFIWLKSVGLIMALIGSVIIIVAILQLNKNLSPFPTPKNSAVLLQNGLYKLVRHPIYSGIVILFLGYGIYKDSAFKLILTFLLLILFYFKTEYEEKLLQNKFPNYIFYKKRTGRFLPKL